MLDRLKTLLRGRAEHAPAVDEVTDRVKRVVEKGPHPTEIFFCAQAGGRVLSLNVSVTWCRRYKP